MYVCVCLFVSYKKGSVRSDRNNVKFMQKIDECVGLAEKSLKVGPVAMKNCILFTGV